MLFSTPSLMTMVHGIVLSGGALLGLAAALFAVRVLALPEGAPVSQVHADGFSRVVTWSSVLLWLAVLGGAVLVFPLYRAAPPADVTTLADYPRAFLLANPETAWLHLFGMEIKEHLPWVAAMLTTAAAFIARRYRTSLLANAQMRRMVSASLVISFAIVGWVALLGVFVNKVAPLQ
jgi:hypothetical protein